MLILLPIKKMRLTFPTTVNYFLFLILLLGVFLVSSCTSQKQIVPVPEEIINATPQEPPIYNETPENLPEKEIFSVNISSFTCDWGVKIGDYNVKQDCVRIISKGTAQGPVGARLELPILSWSDDKFDCGDWTSKTGALIAVGHTCVRSEGQPEIMNWTVDTEGNECPLKDYFNNDRSYSVKIYKDNDLDPEVLDGKKTVCK